MSVPSAYWTLAGPALNEALVSTAAGLSSAEAERRLGELGANVLGERRGLTRLGALWAQLKSPLLLLLVFAAVTSAATREWADAAIVLTIVAVSVGVGYRREYQAQKAVAALRERVKTRARVLRDGAAKAVAVEDLVPGDVVLLAAGSLVPADGVVLESVDLHVSEAALTGESFPALKAAGSVPADTGLARRTNCLWQGTNVRSGTAQMLVVQTGEGTEFGKIAERLELRPPETEFDRGLRKFGYLLALVMLVMVLVVFAVHMIAGHPAIETLLFAIALAVGLSPELLPAILSVNLARAAEDMSKQGVLVRRLNAIENLGSMDILCTDKTGTLTEGVVRLDGAWDCTGAPSQAVRRLAELNAALETGLPSPLDDAILEGRTCDLSDVTKRGEVPFDFNRKRVSVAVEEGGVARLITKGAFHHVLEVCPRADAAALERLYDQWSERGIRVLAVAERPLPLGTIATREAEEGLEFKGFLTFLDRPKEGVKVAIAALRQRGVQLKLITGDGELVARHVAREVGLADAKVLTGADLDLLHDEALWREAERTDLFAEVDPNQKERIILALKKMGHVVGFLGDGVNDAPAMHAADTSLSVDQAVDVAREAADFVLLERGLHVILRGVEQGRRTFANTLKYVLTTTSANLGNMLSMAAASLVLPFLPLTAGQILLNNLLSDVPAVGLATDAVDDDWVKTPRRWDMRFIGRFMIEFGALSSAFDLATFGILLAGFRAGPELFRTGWFVESLLTELAVAMVLRTRGSAFASRPGRVLAWSTAGVAAVALAIPFIPKASALGFVPLPLGLLAAVLGLTVAYVVSTELLKRWFYRRASAAA